MPFSRRFLTENVKKTPSNTCRKSAWFLRLKIDEFWNSSETRFVAVVFTQVSCIFPTVLYHQKPSSRKSAGFLHLNLNIGQGVSQIHQNGNFWVTFSCRFPASFLQVSACSLPLETCRISAPTKDCSIFKDLWGTQCFGAVFTEVWRRFVGIFLLILFFNH